METLETLTAPATAGQGTAMPKPQQRGQKVIDLSRDPLPGNEAISVAGTVLCGFGEVGCIVALPGSGKSNIIESFAASFIAAKTHSAFGVDTIGFKVIPPKGGGKKVLWVDTERTVDDILESKNRLCRRLGQNIADFGQYIEIVSFLHVFSPQQCVATLVEYLETGLYGLVLVDGLLEFTTLNDEKVAHDSIKRICAAASEANVCIVTTIHPNKGTETIAGHAGGFVYRYCRFCLFIRKLDGGIREITSDFPQGKLAKSGAAVSQNFEWCPDKKMMVSTHAAAPAPKPTKTGIVEGLEADAQTRRNLMARIAKEGWFNGVLDTPKAKEALQKGLQTVAGMEFGDPLIRRVLAAMVEGGEIKEAEGSCGGKRLYKNGEG